jgi:hypothetical protein
MNSNLHILQDLDDVLVAGSVLCDIEEVHKHLPAHKPCVDIISQNIRSVYNTNLDDLRITLSQLPSEANVLLLTECRLDHGKQLPIINSYISHCTQFKVNQNDGVVAYIKDNLITRVDELSLIHASGLQITTENLIILGIYRSPSNVKADKFIESLDLFLETIDNKKNIVIVGDININLIIKTSENSDERNNRQKYLEVLSAHGLITGHSLPTRGGSCLDHVFLKLDVNKSAFVTVLNSSITDHSLVLLRLFGTSVNHLTNPKLKVKIDYNSICKSLMTVDFTRFTSYNDPNIMVNALIDLFRTEIHSNTKIIKLSSQNITLKPWMTKGVLRCIRLRNKMQLKLKIDPHNEILKITFKRFRNYCTNLIRKLKSKYYKKKIDDSSKSSKKFWLTINEITPYKAPKTSNINLLEVCHCPLDAVNRINQYFVSIGKSLADEITSQLGHSHYISNSSNSPVKSFVLLDTDPKEVNCILSNLDSSSACGWDGIPIDLLKLCQAFVSPIISHLANLCFQTGIFPTSLKRSIVTPVHKSGNSRDISNFRPISVLNGISKIIEKLLNTRLISFMTKNGTLSKSQYGFRKGMSTQDAIIDLTSDIVDKVDRRSRCLAVFLDLKKAFDTVSTQILIQRLYDIGVRGTALALFKSYLLERKQAVRIDRFVSSEESVNYGVPQGSVLGPTLFLVYINDLCKLQSNGGRVYCYADDTAIVYSGQSWATVKVAAEAGMADIAKWLSTNLLTLNAAKTNYMCFTTDIRTQPKDDFILQIHTCSSHATSMTCNCPQIQKVMFTKYLGTLLDQRLSWHHHIDLVSGRIRKLTWIFKSLRYVMSRELLNKIYMSLAQSIITYCIPVWGGATASKFLDIERAQRSLLKVMYFKPYRYPTEHLYKLGDLLSVRKLYVQYTILWVHKTLPFDSSKLLGRRKTAVASSIPRRTVFAQRQFASQSVSMYNFVNRKLNIYPMLRYECRNAISRWLTTLTHDETERILKKLA